MKIIRKGKKIEGKMRVICKTCKAELEIVAADIKKEPDDGIYPGNYYYICPCCCRNNTVAYNELSDEIRLNMKF